MDQAATSLQWVSLSPLPRALLAVVVAALLVAAVVASVGVWKEAVPWRRRALVGLRLLAALCAAFFLLEPGWREVQIARSGATLAVVVDRSASMAFPLAKGQGTRATAVADALERLGGELAHTPRATVELYGASPELSPVSLQALRDQPPTGSRTDLLASLGAVRAASSVVRPLAGVLLLSDGADHAALAQGFEGATRASLEALKVPVTTVAVGEEALQDLSLEAVRVDDFAFVRSTVALEVDLRARGFKGETVSVVLRREGQVVATQVVKVAGDDALVPVRFSFTPDQTGRFVYSVSTPVLPEEAVLDNNERSFTLKVIRDRMRVLLVSGRPTWDERFLRGLLRQDANVELISFYILRNGPDQTGVWSEERELSLIPFPTEEIFRTKLDTFDVVVLLNFGYTEPQLSLQGYEPDLKRYVMNGGALVVVGGDRSFSESPRPFVELADVIPLQASGPADLKPFAARLTPEGKRHPVTALGGGAAAEAMWAALPPLQGLNLTRATPGATVLLEHPFLTANGAAVPVVALAEFGRGRTLAVATDSAWVWAFTSHDKGAPTRVYERFWASALRWLVRDPDLTTLQLTADPSTVEPGQPVALNVVARKSDYQPAGQAEVSLRFTHVDGRAPDQERTVTTGDDGTARVELPSLAPGAWKVTGRASKDGKPLGEATEALAVRASGPERADAHVGTALLAELARVTGGKALTLGELRSLDQLPLLEPPLVEVGRSKDQPVWDRWHWLLALVLVMGAEWALRRRFGYV